MTTDDRLALEIGRAILRAVSAEARLAQALAEAAKETPPAEQADDSAA